MADAYGHLVGGRRVEGRSGRFGDVYEPATGDYRHGFLLLPAMAEVTARDMIAGREVPEAFAAGRF